MTILMVRKAGLADAKGIATVHVRPWQQAYRGQVDQAYLDGLDPAVREARWARVLADETWPGSGDAALPVPPELPVS